MFHCCSHLLTSKIQLMQTNSIVHRNVSAGFYCKTCTKQVVMGQMDKPKKVCKHNNVAKIFEGLETPSQIWKEIHSLCAGLIYVKQS